MKAHTQGGNMLLFPFFRPRLPPVSEGSVVWRRETMLRHVQEEEAASPAEAAAGGAVLWPLLLLYQEHGQSDFLRQCREDSTLQDHLLAVMDPALTPPPWDPSRTLSPSSVSVYYISNQVPVQHEGEWRWLQDATGRVLPKKWVRVDASTTIGHLVRLEGICRWLFCACAFTTVAGFIWPTVPYRNLTVVQKREACRAGGCWCNGRRRRLV